MPGAYTDQLLVTQGKSNGVGVAKVGGALGGGINFVAPLTAARNAITGDLDVGIEAGAAPRVQVFAGSAAQAGNAAGAIVAWALLNPADFPGWTRATLYATAWVGVSSTATAWAAGAYLVGDFLTNATGAGGGLVTYVVTTPGTASGSHGPVGFGTGLLDQGASAVRYRSATATILVSGGVVGTVPVALTILGAVGPGGAGYPALRLSIDITAAVKAGTAGLIQLTLKGDPDDTIGPYTTCNLGDCYVQFT